LKNIEKKARNSMKSSIETRIVRRKIPMGVSIKFLTYAKLGTRIDRKKIVTALELNNFRNFVMRIFPKLYRFVIYENVKVNIKNIMALVDLLFSETHTRSFLLESIFSNLHHSNQNTGQL